MSKTYSVSGPADVRRQCPIGILPFRTASQPMSEVKTDEFGHFGQFGHVKSDEVSKIDLGRESTEQTPLSPFSSFQSSTRERRHA